MPGTKKTRTSPPSTTAPAAPPMVLEEISLKDLPEFVERAKPSGDFRDFVLDLTEAGQQKAGKIIEDAAAAGNRKAKRQKSDNPTTICLLCVDSGTPIENCFFHHKGNGGNKKKHFKNVHVEKKQLQDGEGYVFKRITELKGKLVGKSDRTVPPPPAPRFGFQAAAAPALVGEATTADLERALATWVCATNQSVESVENPLFRKVLTVAAQVRNPALVTVTKETLGTKIITVGEKLRESMKKRVGSMQAHRLHLLVGKDMETKQARACLTFISEEDPSNLELNILPLPISGESASERISSLSAALKKIDSTLEIGNLAGAKNAEGTEEYNFESICRASIDRISSNKQWDDFDKTKSHGAFDRLVNTVILSALGLLNFQSDGTDIPAGPGESVTNALKSFSGSLQWNTVFARLSESLMESEGPTQQKKMFAEIQAVLEPLANITNALTSSTKPTGSATLVAIALTLHRYGVDIHQGLLYPEAIKPKDDAVLKELRFDVIDIKNVAGAKKSQALKEFSQAGFLFFKCFLQHLIYRLSTKRGNRSFYEVLGLMVDPVLIKYGEVVFGKGNGEWNFDNLQTHVGSCVSRFDAPTAASSTTTAPISAQYADEKLIKPEDETLLKEFIEILDKYNPLEYWSSAETQKKFPSLFRANLVTLGYSSLSTVVDPALGRKRMVENPLLRQAAFVVRQATKAQLDAVDK